ncbi:MAG: WhiB family transcriptional regulator [Nocardioidaceae bacterium]
MQNKGGSSRRPDLGGPAGRRSPHPGDPAGGAGQPTCAGPQAEMFFSEDAGDVERAKGLCTSCARRSACLAGALQRREPWGVWGGELFQAGAVIPYKRPPGRPRKHDPQGARSAASRRWP